MQWRSDETFWQGEQLIRAATNTPIVAKALITAVAIVRMGSTAQEKSPAEQRTEIVKRPARCQCEAVRWYSDDGVSRDNNRKRDKINRLCRDAQSPDRDFDIVLARHLDRVSRDDILDAAEWLRPLRNAEQREYVGARKNPPQPIARPPG
jgi:Resolvase, N terminal domain